MWSRVYLNHVQNSLIQSWKSPTAGHRWWNNRNEAPHGGCKAFVEYLWRCGRAWSQTWNIHNINKNVYTWDSSLRGLYMFLRCTHDQAAIWLAKIWLARIVWDGKNQGNAQRYQTTLSTAILLAEVVGWEWDYIAHCSHSFDYSAGTGEFHMLIAIRIHMRLPSSITLINLWVIAVHNGQMGVEALNYYVCTWCTFVTRGCHGHTECVGVSVDVLCNLQMTVQFLYVASVGLQCMYV